MELINRTLRQNILFKQELYDIPMHDTGNADHCPFSMHVILKMEFSLLVLLTQFRRTYDPGIASLVEVSKTLIIELIIESREMSIGSGSEHRGFSWRKDMTDEWIFRTNDSLTHANGFRMKNTILTSQSKWFVFTCVTHETQLTNIQK